MRNRREFLASSGLALVASPFINLLNVSDARAHGHGAHAKRLLIFFSPDGIVPHLWTPEGNGADYRFAENSLLTPLSDYRNDLLVLGGLDLKTGNNHEGGMAAMLTNGHSPESVTNGMSVDQYIAGQIGEQSRFQSMEFGVVTDPWGASIQTRMCYSGPGKYVHPDSDPQNVFTRMFGGISQDEAALERIKARRRSILDLVRGELTGLKRRLGQSERIKLERHLEGIRTVERSLFPPDQGACQRPTPPGRLNKNDYAAVPAITRAQMDLAVTALGCEMTKVATIQLSHTVSPVIFSWVGNTNSHHDLSHTPDNNADHISQITAADRWCAEQYAYLIDQMKQTPSPDGQGRTLFDDTVILWAKELGDSRLHVCTSVPFILAGAAGGAFRPGRYIDYGDESHSKLLVSICHALGLENETFGDPTTGQGPLGGLS